MEMVPNETHIWFAFGYYDGRELGYQNSYPNTDIARQFYKMGYDRGVSDYCNNIDFEEETEEEY